MMQKPLALAAVLAAAFVGIVGYDYFKIGRTMLPEAGKPQASGPQMPPAPSAPSPPESLPSRADRIVVDKKDRRLTLYANGQPFRTYQVALGGNPVGHKRQEGDRRTPEGRYIIDFANKKSAYHLALRISYPNTADRASAAARGVAPGSDIMIHGLPNGLGAIGAAHRRFDWTNGCIALTNDEIEEVWRLVAVGTPIDINP